MTGALAASLCGLCPLPASAAAPLPDSEPGVVLQQIRSATLDLAHPLDTSGLRLSTGFATLDLESGVLVPVRTAGGRVVEMVFLGQGRVRLEPPDDVEAGQLELFTGHPRLAERFTEAIFVVARDAAAEALLGRPAAGGLDADTAGRARARYDEWKGSPERRTLGVETGLLLDALGDPLYDSYFAGWFLGADLGPFLLQMDPAAEEQVNLGQFVRVEVAPEERQSLTRFLHRQQKSGRLVGLEMEDIGRWDSWIQTPLRTADGRPAPGSPGFEPAHYALEVTVDPRSSRLDSRSRVTLRALGGRRVVDLELHADLEVTGLADAGGRDLFYLRQGNGLQVLLPQAPERGREVVLDVACEGVFLEPGQDHGWALRDSLGWYPRTGANERATYDVTLRWPRRFDLVASGRRLDGGEDGGMRWQRRRMELPTLGFSFEVGRFAVESLQVGHVRLDVALDAGTLELAPEGALGELMSTVADALRFYEQSFGPYPLDELTVVTVPRQYSQAMLGFITLSTRVMVDWGVFGPLLRVQDRGSVVAHEVAHQWWGHLVGWRSYRDQWISEAMANYAALLWARHRGLRPAVGPVTGWQQELTATLADGRPIESLGPMVLGERLFSSRSQDAYHAIVYRKGALVLEMLARKFGERDFLRALEKLVAAASGRVLSTTDFLGLLERITATDLDGFARQFIFGTGLPRIYYDYAFEEGDGGRWRVRVSAEQEMPARTRFAVVPAAGGGLDVARHRIDPELDVESSELVVPFQILLAPDAPSAAGGPDREPMLVGRLVVSGRHTELEFEIDRAPKKLWLDRDREVFGRFLDRRNHPKRRLFQLASRQAATGEPAAAEETLRRALATHSPLASTDALLDTHLHLQLAGVQLDGGRIGEAACSLDLARQAFEQGGGELPSSERRRFANAFEVLEARIEICRGEYEKAFARLRGGVLDPHDVASTEGYLLLAIAAHQTGHTRELEDALAVARRRGADVSRLQREVAGAPVSSAL